MADNINFPFACGPSYDAKVYVISDGADAVSVALQYDESNHSKIERLIQIVGRLAERSATDANDLMALVGLSDFVAKKNPHA